MSIAEDTKSIEDMIVTGLRLERGDQSSRVLLGAIASALIVLCRQAEALTNEVEEIRRGGLMVQTPTNCF